MSSDAGHQDASHCSSESESDEFDQDSGDMAKVKHIHKAGTKDPNRPRRKKARRACGACQRAHLTCSDKRPCDRCTQRHIEDSCRDGFRKKAKYLCDAPLEALQPGFDPRGSSTNQYQYPSVLGRPQPITSDVSIAGYPSNVVSDQQRMHQAANSTFPLTMPPSNGPLPNQSFFGYQQSPASQSYSGSSAPQTSPIRAMPTNSQSSGQLDAIYEPNQYPDPLQDLKYFAQLDFDPLNMDYTSHYAGAEHSMIGHMASGAVETPPSDSTGQYNNTTSYGTPNTTVPSAFSSSPVGQQPYLPPQDPAFATYDNNDDFMKNEGGAQAYSFSEADHNPFATYPFQDFSSFSIGSGSGNLSDPSSTSNPVGLAKGFETNAVTANMTSSTLPVNAPADVSSRSHASITTPQLKAEVLPTIRKRDPSEIYESVTEPWSYTNGYHALTALLQNRFSSSERLRVAKALASFRPSFIACTKTLSRDDLIFMEKCFQRTLLEYDGFINAIGVPTLVCRRTGEVAAVGKEFSKLTGWGKDVLLGKEPNLNINRGESSSKPPAGNSSKGGFNTPRNPSRLGALDASRPQPVFLLELLDDESAIEFYEDFAQLAFSNSRGSVRRQCKVLKYRTKDFPGQGINQGQPLDEAVKSSLAQGQQTVGRNTNRINGESAVGQLGGRDGKVDCVYCWTVKRDVFDIPMLIVLNFLPCI